MKVIRIAPEDNAAVCLRALAPGEAAELEGEVIIAKDEIPAGHKIALRDIRAGEKIVKYANPIGHATGDIEKGRHIHSHNLASDLSGAEDFVYEPDFVPLPSRKPEELQAFRRKDGRIGIRNEIWIIPTVGCAAPSVRQMEKESQKFLCPGIDGIYSFSHPYGCSQLGEDQEMTLALLSSLAQHPNAAGVLIVGLGCENAHIGEFKRHLGDYDPERIRFLVCQESEDEIAEGVSLIGELCEYAKGFTREACSCAELVVGLKCGGSDGFSGISANALIGRFTDGLIARGGSAILTEVPEMFGAERVLMKRCRTKKQFEDTVELINGFREYFLKHGEKINENPSPGNKAGGITTLEEKSLGCVQKGGRAPIEDVIGYGRRIGAKGLSLLRAPGNDLVSSAALAAAGAHLILFSTGRGTPFTSPVPTLKISSNSDLYRKKKSWIDFDAGRLLTGADVDRLDEEFFSLILDVSSGNRRAISENFDKHELAVFKDGVTL